ncbi:phosphohydrolase [Stenotrophomonas maltophilia]|uniref:phosphohydrolase n=1 Tax=Stenotrophomonas maltophilia TaxID=40324 RepID=UPI0021C6AFA1|nr:phosphohydrolase [Stenotrophomonas maltophilia]MCU1136822.1 phosphohydrolase [Stenotrophomonas maltophilia]
MTQRIEHEVVARARRIAERAHANQVDQAGQPYIEHVRRVAEAVADDPAACALAWLHDVKEDHPEFSAEIDANFAPEFVAWINLLTRKDSNVEAYYAALIAQPLPLRVKKADVDDNCNEGRLALLDPQLADRLRRKYAKARRLLNETES